MSDNFPTTPHWPQSDIPSPPPPPVPPRNTHPPLLTIGLAISIAVNVVLFIALLMVLLLERAGAFTPAASTGQSAPSGATSTATHSTPSVTPSPTGIANWLHVVPTSVQLRCRGDQQMQSAVLTNSGPQTVQWQVDFGGQADQAPVHVSPNQGNLQSGSSMTIQIQVNGQASDQHGVIRFNPATSMAGSPPSLSYAISGCQGG